MNIMKSDIQKKHSCSFTHYCNISPKQLNINDDIYTNSSTYAVGRLTIGLGFPPTGDFPKITNLPTISGWLGYVSQQLV